MSYFSLLVSRGLKRCRARESTPEQTLIARRRGLRLGVAVAIAILAGWLISSAADAIALRALHLDLAMPGLLRFFLWSLMCACLASAYPYFAITFVALRSLYPAFLQHDLEGAAHDEPLLKQLGRWSSFFLVLAVLAPLLSIAALLADKLIDPNLIHSDAELAMGFFCALCLIGLLPVFWLYQSIQSDLTTFSGITAPHERAFRGPSASRSGAHRAM